MSESMFGLTVEERERAKKAGAPEPAVCAYLGHERLERVRRLAKARRKTVSRTICELIDAGETALARRSAPVIP